MSTILERCHLCSSVMKGITVHDFMMGKGRSEIDWQLCPNHALVWVMRQLEPSDVLKIRSLAGGDTFHTHFYDEAGNSLQPIRLE
jgi:hypothetical protein